MMKLELGTPLTPTEREALFLASYGLSDAQIAHRLDLTVASARTYMHRVRCKLGARNRAHAVRLGFEGNILTAKAGD